MSEPTKEAKDAVEKLMMEDPRKDEEAARFIQEAIDSYTAKFKGLPALLLECRDALPAISITAAKLHGIRLDLADRIEAALEPWRVKE